MAETPRERVLARLQRTLDAGQPIFAGGCSAGIIAKCAEIGGADLAVVYSTGRSRLMGLPTSRFGDSNAITLEMCDELLNVVEEIPIIAGLDGADIKRLRFPRLLQPFVEVGISGVINFPTIAMMGGYRETRDMVHLGFNREVELIAYCRSIDLFTMAYVFNVPDAEAMVRSGVDCVVAHAGPTEGGLSPIKFKGSLEQTLANIEDIFAAARALRPDILCLAHGGPFGVPDDLNVLYERTRAQGFVGASSMERIPIEKAIIDTARAFKAITLPGRR